jgi:hypothetical protein
VTRAPLARTALVAAAVILAACNGKGSPPTAAPDAAPSSARPVASARPPASGRVVPLATGCRAIAVTGKAEVSGKAVTQGAPIDGSQFIDFSEGSKLTAKHARSGRELTLEGPGRAIVCRGGDEQVLLASGKLKSAVGTGARPGAEVLVATPFGIVRYGEAALEVRALPKKVEVAVTNGETWVEPAAGATRKGADHLAGPKGKASLHAGPNSTAEKLVLACAEAARLSAESARAVLAPTPGGPDAGTLGERAAVQLRARRTARAACAVAGSAVGLLDDPAERERLRVQVDSSDRLWQAVPRRGELGRK